jgi:hypothetical protein
MTPGKKTDISLFLLLFATPAIAQDLPPQMGQYMPLYPGMYFNGGYLQDPRDSAYDANGDRQDTVAPAAGGQSSFPEKLAVAAFTWHFPMFESYGLPYVSSRTHLARVTLDYGQTRTKGQLASYVESQQASNDLQNNGDGLGDTLLEFGTFLYGAGDWRTRTHSPFSALGLFGLNVPTGAYERNAPVNIGTNTWAYHAKLGLHGNFWPGGFIEAGAGYRQYVRNEEPAFGGLAPHKQGQDKFWDASASQKIWGGLYAGVFIASRRGGVNEYKDPQISPNPGNPTPPPGSDNFPTPGLYYDHGTALSVYGASLHYFITQRWLAALNVSRPRSGKSGEFDVNFTNRTPANCLVGGANCTTSPGGSAHEDGYGPARSYASSAWMLTVSHNFYLGDFFTCTGCEP